MADSQISLGLSNDEDSKPPTPKTQALDKDEENKSSTPEPQVSDTALSRLLAINDDFTQLHANYSISEIKVSTSFPARPSLILH
jgi:hypothetical protein